MIRLLSRAAVSALAVAAFSGLVIPPTASAADVHSTQLKICNKSAADQKFHIVGYNQFHDWVTSQTEQVNPYSCYNLTNWWWQTNRSFELHWEVANSVPNWKYRLWYIPGTAKSGGWQTATIE
ncbi:hypothetical protein [Streptomyces mirabilis]|uniref:hypothetical protein n=1 Tax=Streptomyces mirabilis TaxID=68239 RepID=UPI00365309A0